jgi:TolA-binding protein
MTLEDHVAALAALGASDDDRALAAATRLRVRESLERGHAWQRHAGALVALAVLLVASCSWALATGKLQRWLAHEPSAPRRAATVAMPPIPDPPAAQPAVRAVVAQPQLDSPASEPAQPTHQRTTDPAEALYERAHELHFRGDAPAAALVAWNAYLAAAPDGTFAIEARYNRALCLVKLGRLAEARTALEPYARGDVVPAGYRQSDAAHLIERIDRHLNGSR